MAIVPHLDVFEDVLACLRSGRVNAGDALALQRWEEALNYSIVVAIPLSAHAHLHAVIAEQLQVPMRSVLAASACVLQHSFSWLALGGRHLEI